MKKLTILALTTFFFTIHADYTPKNIEKIKETIDSHLNYSPLKDIEKFKESTSQKTKEIINAVLTEKNKNAINEIIEMIKNIANKALNSFKKKDYQKADEQVEYIQKISLPNSVEISELIKSLNLTIKTINETTNKKEAQKLINQIKEIAASCLEWMLLPTVKAMKKHSIPRAEKLFPEDLEKKIEKILNKIQTLQLQKESVDSMKKNIQDSNFKVITNR